MKLLLYPILTAHLSLVACATDVISTDNFEKANARDREKMLTQASPEQKEGLRKIDVHLKLLTILGGEAGLKLEKESFAARARGFKSMEALLGTQRLYWSDYMNGVFARNEKAGMPLEMRQTEMAKQWEAFWAAGKRESDCHSLVFNLAPSPQAMELEAKVEILNKDLEGRFNLIKSVPGRFVTKEQKMEVDKQTDEILSQLKKLLSLSPEEAKKEFDEFPEDIIFGRDSMRSAGRQ